MKRPLLQVKYSAACRYCYNQAFTVDAEGPLHSCCQFWYETEGSSYCVACKASEVLAERQREKEMARRREGRPL